jgi:hypothetical protein
MSKAFLYAGFAARKGPKLCVSSPRAYIGSEMKMVRGTKQLLTCSNSGSTGKTMVWEVDKVQ